MIDLAERNKFRALHILAACDSIIASTKGLNQDDFFANAEKVNSAIYQLIIIGEAVGHIDYDILDKYSYPWYKVKAFRNYAAHEYFNIEIWTVWEIVSHHVIELRKVILKMIEKEFSKR